ncbi:2-phospho-L-lactate guanylyltransferase [Rhodococcus opacus]|uniref:2-phospho-L-lactate guanylyltransferase n=1 Tax=Rhodococcus opacus TaxID=37919 RepID=UPI0024770AAF|nr:2-phospho-L-lactate guanylyltransferase [Rhodococcus opacus]MDH6293286.1 2-phospho-L-lactate guanylyltransferase [Rhodococcus opacus]
MSDNRSGGYGVVVPIKSLGSGKSRLTIGSAKLRADLTLAFFLDTVSALQHCNSVTRVVVVTSDKTVISETKLRCEIAQDREIGMSEAIDLGIDRLGRSGHDGPVAAVVPDLPCATPEAFDALFSHARRHQRAFLPDAKSSGTTCVTAAAAELMVHHFGPSSALAHTNAGLVPLDSRLMELRTDVDTPSDLYVLSSLKVGSATAAVLPRWDDPLLASTY